MLQWLNPAMTCRSPNTQRPAATCVLGEIPWRQYAVETGQIDSWLWHQGRQPGNEIQRVFTASLRQQIDGVGFLSSLANKGIFLCVCLYKK